MASLRPSAGFNWTAVGWGGPDEPVSDTCSYCDAVIPEDDVPLIMWDANGWTAQFCDACQARYWDVLVR
jgi:hypothetical protein